MTLKAELPVFPEGGIYPPWAEKPKYPPLAENTPPGNFGHSRCLASTYKAYGTSANRASAYLYYKDISFFESMGIEFCEPLFSSLFD